MPTYQYRCTDCGESFERYQSFSDDPITVCPLPAEGDSLNGADATCGGEVRKIFSNVGISFKGSGFYRNDSRSGSASSDSSSSGTSDSGTSAPSNGSSSSSSSSGKSPSSSNNSGTKDSASSASKDSSTVGAASASG